MMPRRSFVELLGATVAGSALLPGGFAESRRLPFRAWTWVHANGTDTALQWRTRFARFRAGGISGVIVGGGDPGLIGEAAHAEGLAFHVWAWMLNRNGDSWVQSKFPEWFDVSRKGESSLTHPPYVGYYKWLCPTRPEVRAYLNAQVKEAAQVGEVEGVHLDYIRHPDVILPRGLWDTYHLVQDHEMPEYDFCYCPVCRTTFAQASGYDPLSLPDPSTDMAWRKFRWDSITNLVKELSATVRAHNKLISAAVFPTPSLARMQVRQAWDQWPLDLVFPMTYHKFHSEDIPWIGRAAREGVDAIPATEPLYAGLHLPDLDPPSLVRAVNAAREGGAAGVSLYDSGSLSDAHLAALRTAVTD